MRAGNAGTGLSLPADIAPSPGGRSELRTRLASALVLAPVALGAMILGGLPFAALVVTVAVIALWEWISITAPDARGWIRALAFASLVAGLLALTYVAPVWPLCFLAAVALVALAGGLAHVPAFWTGLGFLYVAIPAAALILLRQADPLGWAAVLFVLVVVWATDIAAFFAGRRFGGPKLWPRVSPKKTWSGAVGGLVAAIVAGGLTVWLAGAGGVPAGLALAVPLSLATQAGDLLESALKRRFGVKDSSHVIPGHGGVLDRVDGLFGAAALAWLIAALGLGGVLLVLPGDVAALSQGAA